MNTLWSVGGSASGFSAVHSFSDAVVFLLFLLAVIFVAFRVSRKSGDDSESYFLAGRGLSWWLIGFSLIAANISAEQFVGMSGQASDYIGLAVASYEWIAAISLVIVAFFFLPRFLKAGIYTIPEYLEHRYNKSARTIMSLLMMVMLVCVNITVVTYAGAKNYAVFFDGVRTNISVGDSLLFDGNPFSLTFFCWVIGIIAAAYVFAGGLKACAWADLLQGSALIIGGAIVLFFSFRQLGLAEPMSLAGTSEISGGLADKLAQSSAWERFLELNGSKLRMNLPSWDTVLPVTALIFAIWIPNLYYWGLNQYIIQRTLGAKSLGEGQKGLVFAACMKLLIPFIVIFPGLIAFNLYHAEMMKTAATNSKPILSRFDEAKKSDVASLKQIPFFRFNRDFVRLHPDLAQEILSYNSKAYGVEIPTKKGERTLALDEQASEMRYSILKKIKNDPEKSKQFVEESLLTGYDHDAAFPLLVRNLVPSGGFKGFLLAALLGAIISSVAAMLNAASTIFTMDIYREYLHRSASQETLVRVGRYTVLVFVILGCIIAPMWANPKYGGVFKAIQEFQGYISPGIFAAFMFGFCVKRAPAACGTVALLLCPVLYGLLHLYVPSLDFLNRMLVTFVVIIAILTIMRIVAPRKTEYEQSLGTDLDLTESLFAKVIGVLVVIGTVILYLTFWDYDLVMF